jgi:transcriptional regulator GlxA family with amidase domain
MRIAVLAYDGISPFMLSTPLAVFGEALSANGHRVDICASSPRVSATGGLVIEVPYRLSDAHDAGAVIIPGWRDADEPVTPDIVSELRQAHARGAIVVGLCLGAFGLGEAGLLDGRRATTHWARTDTFAARFPEVRVDPGALYVDEGQILTSAGVASGLDCCIHLLARISGVAEANRAARHLVVAPQRSGEQQQLLDRPAIGSDADKRVSGILEALRADPSKPFSLDEVANNVGLSRRSLTRHVRAQTGDSLGAWVRRARVMRAQELLATGARGFQDVAHRSGFPDAHAMQSAFRVEFGMTPSQWLARQRL